MIPKLIHQTASDISQLDGRLRNNISSLQHLNPDWQYKLYEDHECRKFIIEHYGHDFASAYDRFNEDYGAARADWFRYLLMYRLGGVYLDIKSSCLCPLSEVLRDEDEFILSHWSEMSSAGMHGRHPEYGVDNEFQQWNIISRPEHPFLKAVITHVKSNIDNYVPARDGVGKWGVLKLTGPIAYTKSILPIVRDYPHRLVEIENLGFVYSVITDKAGRSSHKRVISSRYRKSTKPILKISRSEHFRFLLHRFGFRS